MQLTITDREFLFTITAQELEELQDGQTLKNALGRGRARFNYAIKPYSEDVFTLCPTPLSIVLFIGPSELKRLTGPGPVRDSLSGEKDRLLFSLNVEREDKKTATKSA